jgi:hypothetical protein
LQGVYIFLMFLYIINFGFPLQASRDIRVDRKVALTVTYCLPLPFLKSQQLQTIPESCFLNLEIGETALKPSLIHGYTEEQDGKVGEFVGGCSSQKCLPHHERVFALF